MNWLLAPFQYSFMQHGFIAALLVGSTCAVLGVYVVLRRMAFMGDALAHSVLPGLVIAHLNSWNLFAGAIVAGFATAFGIGYLSQRARLQEDTAIGILFAGMFAFGILLMSTTRSFRDLSHMLFGNIMGVTSGDLALIAILSILVLSVLVVFHKELELTSVDPIYAAAIGLKANTVRYGLLALLALTIVTAIQAVGVVLTSALLVTPAATASLLTNSLPRMMILAILIAVGASIAGLYASFYLNVSAGAAIVLTCTVCFASVWMSQMVKRGARTRDRHVV